MAISQSDLFATIFFWSAFVVSAGPFWTATMAAATSTSFKTLYANYMLYLIFGWLPLIAFIGTLVSMFGVLGEKYILGLHIVGTLVVFGMAWKIWHSRPGKSSGFDFNWKAMSILSWVNPKVWLLVPIGFLNAKITGIWTVDIFLYGVIGVPLFLVGVYVWGSIGRLGAKISLTHVNKFNGVLMGLFGVYLMYSALQLYNTIKPFAQ